MAVNNSNLEGVGILEGDDSTDVFCLSVFVMIKFIVVSNVLSSSVTVDYKTMTWLSRNL
jgi:hypothetical protein